MATVLITGASSGLGSEFARLCAADGKNLVLIARSADALGVLAEDLRKAHGITVEVLAHDLTEPDAVQHIVAGLAARNIEVDELINNAGVGKLSPFAETDERDLRGMLDLNVSALTMLTRALLPKMIARKRGRILNVASTASFQPGPLMAVYYATKAYVLHWSLALGNELNGSGITVTCLCPGPTKTGFQKAAGMLDSPLFKRFQTMDAVSVARAGYDAMLRGKPMVVPGLMNKVGAFATRLIPRTLAARIARAAQETR